MQLATLYRALSLGWYSHRGVRDLRADLIARHEALKADLTARMDKLEAPLTDPMDNLGAA